MSSPLLPPGGLRLGTIAGYAGLVLVSLFFLAFIIAPLVVVLGAGCRVFYWREIILNPIYRQGLFNAAAVALTTTALCMAFALPLAWLGSRYRFRGKGLAEALLLAPLVLPPFVGALGVYQLLGQFGIVNSVLEHLGLCRMGQGPDWMGHDRFAIVCVVEALGLYPILYLLLSAAFGRMDNALLEAARSLGASPWTAFRRVVLPLARPALFGGGIVIFVWSFTELGTPLMLGYNRVTPVQVWMGLNELSSNYLPYALVLVMLVISAGSYLLARLLFARRYDVITEKGGGAAQLSRPLYGWHAVLAWIPFLALAVLAMLPHLVVMVVGVAKDWYRTALPHGLTTDHLREALSHPQVVPGIINSVAYSLSATVLCLVIGVFIAWTTVRWKPLGWQVLDLAAMTPLAVPGIIFAFGYLGIGHLFPLLDPIKNPAPLLIIAYAVRRLPLVVRASAAGLTQSPLALEEAAASLGAGRLYTLRRITLPLIAASLAAGALLVFSASMLEVSDSMVLAQNRDAWPITRVIYDLVAALGSGPAVACAFATWAMLFLISALASAGAFLGRSPSTLFRE